MITLFSIIQIAILAGLLGWFAASIATIGVRMIEIDRRTVEINKQIRQLQKIEQNTNFDKAGG